jgi:competence CoiA-like predicted nuclease
MRYAIDKEESLIEVKNALNGLKCECTCKCCGELVLSKQGKKKEWHFAHVSKIDCKYSNNPGETDLHILAKEVFKEHKTLLMDRVYFEDKLVIKSSSIKFDKIEIEKRVDNFIPDIIAYKGNSCVWIEIAVTHFTDRKKIDYCKKNNITLIEIDLSKTDRDITKELLKEEIVDSVKKRFLWSSKIFNKINNHHAINFNKYKELIDYKENGLNKEFFGYDLIDNIDIEIVNNNIKLQEREAKQQSLKRVDSSMRYVKENIKDVQHFCNWWSNEQNKRYTKKGVHIKPHKDLILFIKDMVKSEIQFFYKNLRKSVGEDEDFEYTEEGYEFINTLNEMDQNLKENYGI